MTNATVIELETEAGRVEVAYRFPIVRRDDRYILDCEEILLEKVEAS